MKSRIYDLELVYAIKHPASWYTCQTYRGVFVKRTVSLGLELHVVEGEAAEESISVIQVRSVGSSNHKGGKR